MNEITKNWIGLGHSVIMYHLLGNNYNFKQRFPKLFLPSSGPFKECGNCHKSWVEFSHIQECFKS